MSRNSEAKAAILACMPYHPMKFGEIAEACGLDPMIVFDGVAYLAEKGVLKGIRTDGESHRGCGATIYYLPGDEDMAWIKFEKFHSQDTQRKLDREIAVLRMTAEQGVATISDYQKRGLYTQVTDVRDMLREGILQKMQLNSMPPGWKGPHNNTVLYYIPGMERRAAERVAEWLDIGPERPNRKWVRDMGIMLRDVPYGVENEVRKITCLKRWNSSLKGKIKRVLGKPYRNRNYLKYAREQNELILKERCEE